MGADDDDVRIAEREGLHISLWQFSRYGLIVTAVTKDASARHLRAVGHRGKLARWHGEHGSPEPVDRIAADMGGAATDVRSV